jgi:hypothetical protein
LQFEKIEKRPHTQNVLFHERRGKKIRCGADFEKKRESHNADFSSLLVMKEQRK